MNGDITQTRPQGDDEHRRASDLSKQTPVTRPPGDAPGYTLLRRLGGGAYGEVWLAVPRNNPGQQVAVKFYTHRGSDWALLAREVEKLNFLATDSHVVQLLDVGWTAKPPYYVMQYFETGSLGKWLENGRLAVPDAVAIFREIVVGLVHAHNRGVLHCDLKPDNILLDKDYKPRLADFGQSRLAGEQGSTLGTLFYMPPEQATMPAEAKAGEPERGEELSASLGPGLLATIKSAPHGVAPDARWDVYALGALLYGMLTGSAPYRTPGSEGFIREATTLPDQLHRYRQVLLTQPRPTAHHEVEGIDRRLIDIIDRCLAVEPGKRFANAQAVLDALDARALARARRPVYLLTAVAGLLMLVGTILFTVVLLGTAVEHSETTLTERVLENNRFAAEFGAKAAGREIELRWQALQEVAGDEAFHDLVRRAAAEADTTGPAHMALQDRLSNFDESLSRTFGGGPDSMFVTDASGTQLARSPYKGGTTVGKNYAHRDYFHGQGSDLKRGEAQTKPIGDPHLSIVFRSEVNNRPRVGFTVPIISDGTTLGVLGMSVEPGHFVELQPPSGTGRLVAVLVDARPDCFDPTAPGRDRGLILQHPRLDAYFTEHPNDAPPRFGDAERLDQLWSESGPSPETFLLREHHDPLAAPGEDQWLAAMAPVEVKGGPGTKPPRWVVLVQQCRETAVAPVDELRGQLLSRGLMLLGVLAAVVGGLALFLAWVLNDQARSPLHRFLRRRAGLDPLSTGKPTPLLPLTIRQASKTLSGPS